MKKKFLSLGTAFLIAIGVGLNPMVVSAIVTYPKITIDEDGQLRDVENNKLLIKRDSIFKFVTEEKEYLQTFTGRRFYEFKKVPSDEELAALAKEWYPSDSSFDYSTAPDYAKPSVFLIISNESDSFVLGIDKNGVTRKYDDIDPEVKYEFDGINHCIKDYSTGKVLEEFTNPVAPGAAETIKYPANGYIKLVHFGKDGITGSLIHYNGSNEEEILLSMYDGTTTYESLTGDINFDGVVDTTDLTTISLALIGDQKFAPLQDELSDVDGDAKVTIADLARLQQYLSKKIDKL